MAKVSESVSASLYDQLETLGKQKSIDLVLYTRGGDTEAPWRIVSLIREYCDRFSVLVPHRAHSAGTLIAMGADEIVMSTLGVLGPIDPSRTHPLLPRRDNAEQAEPVSVQDMRHAMQFIMETAKPSGDTPYTPDAMAHIVTALFNHIHPLAIGAIEQSYALAKLIATKCLSTHMNPITEKEKIEEIVNKLCDDYKSHSYPINRREALEIGLNVVPAPPDVDVALMELFKFYVGRDLGNPIGQNPGQKFVLKIAYLDSTALQIRVEQDAQMGQGGTIERFGDRFVPY